MSQLYAMAPPPQQAGAANGPAPSGPASLLSSPLPLIVIFFGLFYMIIWRPQQKQAKERQKMVAALKAGDQVVTNSGIYGTVTKVNEDDTLVVKIAEGVQVKMSRQAVESLAKK